MENENLRTDYGNHHGLVLVTEMPMQCESSKTPSSVASITPGNNVPGNFASLSGSSQSGSMGKGDASTLSTGVNARSRYAGEVILT